MHYVRSIRWMLVGLLIALLGCEDATNGGGDASTLTDAASPSDGGLPRDASSVDGSTPDAARLDAGTSTFSCTGASVCEDFEATPVDGLPADGWTVSTPNCSGTGSLAVTNAYAHSGARSLAVTGGGGYCNHVFLSNGAPATIAGTLHVRFFVRLESALSNDHVTFVAMHDEADGKDLRMGGQSQILMWNRELNDATLPALSPTGISLSTALSPGAWHCIEAEIDGSGGTLRTSVDGVAIAGLEIDATPTNDVDGQWLQSGAWNPSLTDIRFGWESYGGQAMNLWFDDLAIGDSPIGCE